MNAKDRKRLAEAQTLLETAHGILEDLGSAEQEKFENMSDGLKASERGQAIERAADELINATGNVQDAIDALGNVE